MSRSYEHIFAASGTDSDTGESGESGKFVEYTIDTSLVSYLKKAVKAKNDKGAAIAITSDFPALKPEARCDALRLPVGVISDLLIFAGMMAPSYVEPALQSISASTKNSVLVTFLAPILLDVPLLQRL